MQQLAEEPLKDSETGRLFFTPAQLTTMMRTGAWNLDLSIHRANAINFVVIFTEDAHPVHVQTADGPARSFCYPNWGGAYIWNAGEAAPQLPASLFAGNLLSILGMASGGSPADTDRLLLALTRTNMHRIANAHSAVTDLLAKSPFIEIPADLARRLAKWHDSAEQIQAALRAGDIAEAARASARAAKHAEASFYHRSLLGKMYFPDEHKAAIYLPLLLPSLLPVVVGLVKLASQSLRRP